MGEMNGGGDGGSKTTGASSAAVAVGNSSSLAFRLVWVVVACLALPTLVFVSGVHMLPSALVPSLSGDMPSQQQRPRREPVINVGRDGGFALPPDDGDKLQHDSLVAGGFDGESCLSREQISLYRKASPWEASRYLLQRLREYEARHKLCAPNTESYNKTLALLKSGTLTAGALPPDCKYVVWSPRDGLGNRMLSLASAFLYCIITGRVLLIDRSKDMADLFCEPFPETTWLLPLDFPLDFYVFHKSYPQSYGKMRSKMSSKIGGTGSLPALVYLHLAQDYDDDDKRFFCDAGEEHSPLQKVPWVVVRSNQYFVPALFLNPAFDHELQRLFPLKEAVFHLLSRYLFHPTNDVWGLITRYYQAYLAMAEERVGIQIRVFNKKTAPFEVVLHQILNCTLIEKLLPEVTSLRPPSAASGAGDSALKSVLLTSLSSGYFDRIKEMYWEHPAAGGVAVRVHQPSHEEWQQTESGTHDMRALAEIYLLSFSDTLVTTAGSTFGYIAQALGGLRPWILLEQVGAGVPEPACVRALSSEPCFQYPPNYDCRAKRHGDLGTMVPHVRHCEDVNWGLKLVEQSEK